MRCETMVGTINTRTTARTNQRGPAITSEGGNAAYKPPMAITATPAGQRGSRLILWFAALPGLPLIVDDPRLTANLDFLWAKAIFSRRFSVWLNSHEPASSCMLAKIQPPD